MRRVVILQEYVPAYRVRFFELLRERALQTGIELVVAAGEPRGTQGLRQDSGSLAFRIPIRQTERRIFDRRLVVRKVTPVISGADLVIMEQARRNLDAYRLLATPRRHRPMVALWGHGKDYTLEANRIDRAAHSWLTRRADWFFAYTEGGAKAVAGQGFPHHRITVVQNAIDTQSLESMTRDVSPDELRTLAVDHDLRGRTALFLGALDESKRLDFLIEAACVVAKQDPDFRLLLGGDGPLRAKVEARARDCPWMSYLGGLSGSRKAGVMKSAQVLAIPGRVGLIAVDSFAARVPIVTTDWPWHAPEFEYLVSGRNALIAPDTVEGYAAALSEALADGALLPILEEGCRESALVYTLEVMVDRFVEGLGGALPQTLSA